MSGLEWLAIGSNVAGAVLNITMAVLREKNYRDYQRVKKERDELIPAASFVVFLAHPDSPAPELIRTIAKRLSPAWMQDLVEVEIETTITETKPSGSTVH